MNNYIVSARKYRPSDFHSVVGQQHITQTLKNAIASGQLAQAFLFCGPRGVGKTTCARILAKAINCTNLTPEIEACNACESCQSFNKSSSFDIFELDAASNNSVDDIRELVHQVSIPPMTGKYKVYIIDEVHMLSQQAFNAFLKTLEEPPAYAKFILATTEKQKIIPTILSRCQIFDFHRIKTDDIVAHLAFVAEKENVSAERTALHVIAQKSDGGMRDALSTFDQLVNFTAAQLTYNRVIDCLNVLDYDYYFKVVDLLLQGDMQGVLLLFDEILSKGFEGRHFINGFSQHVRDLLVCRDASTQPLMEISDEIKPRYAEQAKRCHPTFLLRILDFANSCAIEYRDSQNKRLCVELALLKMANVMSKLQGKPTPPPPPPVVAPVSAPAVVASPATEPAAEPTPVPPAETSVIAPSTAATPPPIISPYSIRVESPDKTTLTDEKKKPITKPTEKLSWDAFKDAWDTMLLEMENALCNAEAENMTSKSETTFRYATDALLSGLLIAKISPAEQDNHINIEFKNALQATAFSKNYRDILSFMRAKLSVTELQFDIVIEKQESESIIYTAEDKYKYLVEKNPSIALFRDNLEMMIDI